MNICIIISSCFYRLLAAVSDNYIHAYVCKWAFVCRH